MEEPKDFIKTKSGLVLEVVNTYCHRDWVTVTARDASGQLHYLDSRRDEFESLPEKDSLECNIILFEKRIKEIDKAIEVLGYEQELLRKAISIYREKTSRLYRRINPIEDFEYD